MELSSRGDLCGGHGLSGKLRLQLGDPLCFGFPAGMPDGWVRAGFSLGWLWAWQRVHRICQKLEFPGAPELLRQKHTLGMGFRFWVTEGASGSESWGCKAFLLARRTPRSLPEPSMLPWRNAGSVRSGEAASDSGQSTTGHEPRPPKA